MYMILLRAPVPILIGLTIYEQIHSYDIKMLNNANNKAHSYKVVASLLVY